MFDSCLYYLYLAEFNMYKKTPLDRLCLTKGVLSIYFRKSDYLIESKYLTAESAATLPSPTALPI